MDYFDNAATTYPKPSGVLPALHQAVRQYGGNPGRSGHRISLQTAEKVYEIRKKAAMLFHAEAENTIFTSNCTHALNLAIKGLLKDGDHVVTTCLEHNSVLRPLHALSEAGVIRYSVADAMGEDDEILANLKQEITPQTKAMVITHASNVIGKVMPIREIGELCRSHGIKLIVDAAQSAGVLPIDMEQMGIHILCTAGHKGLYGTTGTGLLLMRETEPLTPLTEGGTGSQSNSLDQPLFHPDRYESGTVNTCGILALSAGIDFVNRKGISTLYRHELGLCRYFAEQLQQIAGITLYAPLPTPQKQVPIVLFNLDGISSMVTAGALDRGGFALRGGLHCAPLVHQKLGTQEQGAVRFSPGAFNTMEQTDRLIKYLKKIRKNHVNLLEI